MVCVGCGGPIVAGAHRIVLDAQHNEVAWHPDCHTRSATGCEVCQNIVTAYPDLKDEELGNAIVNKNPNQAVLEG